MKCAFLSRAAVAASTLFILLAPAFGRADHPVGHVVGAIGVSGAASAQQDDAIAQAAGSAFSTGAQRVSPVVHQGERPRSSP